MKDYCVPPKGGIKLADYDPNDTGKFNGGKKEAREALMTLNKELASMQELLYAEGKQKLLIVLQAMDTGGKDGTIRRVFEGVIIHRVSRWPPSKCLPLSSWHMIICGAFTSKHQAKARS